LHTAVPTRHVYLGAANTRQLIDWFYSKMFTLSGTRAAVYPFSYTTPQFEKNTYFYV